jgi:hypothetical protein
MEAIAAMVILSVAVPPMLWAIRDARQQQVGPVLVSRARCLAAEKIEEVIADRHSTTRGFAWIQSARYPAESPVAGFAGFARSVSIAETGASLSGAGTGYKVITVTVTWTDGTGDARSLSLSTVVTDYSS